MTREEAIEVIKVKADYLESDKRFRAAVETIIPELRESEDERIRKKMIEHFKSKTKDTWCNMPVKSILAWLEKQGNPADKIESKFKVGDWIVFNGLTLYVKEVVKGFYITVSKGGIINSYDWSIDNLARLWTT